MERKSWFEWFQLPIGVNIWAPEWYSSSIRAFDAEAIARVLDESGSGVGFTFQGFSQDHFGMSFFHTSMGPVHPNLAPDTDHIAQYQAALNSKGIRFFAYYCFQDRAVWDAQPDFRVRDEQGVEVMGDNFGDLCPNSPYRDHVVRRVAEIARRYQPDGWLLDMVQFATSRPVCHCPYCRRKYRLRYGRQLPAGAPEANTDWLLLLKWRYACVEELLVDIVRAIKAETPEAVVTHNAFALRNADEWITGEDYEALFAHDDVVTNIVNWEYPAGTDIARSPDMIWKAGFYTRVFRGLSRKPVWMQLGRFLYQRDYTVVSQRELEISLFSVVAAGGSPFLIDNAFPDGTVDPRAAKRIALAYRKVKAKEAYLNPDVELAYAAVLYSKQSQDLCDLAQPGEGRYGMGLQGLCQALTEAHMPYQVISDRQLDAETLARYRMVILSDCAAMSEKTASLLEAYVRVGGALVCMGKTGLWDENGTPHPRMLLEDTLGIRHRGPLNYAVSFVAPAPHAMFAGMGEDDLAACHPLRGCYPERFDAGEGTQIVLHSRLPATEVVLKQRVFTYGSDVAPGEETEPFATLRHVDKGRAVYLGGNLARCYGLYGDPALKELLVTLLKDCASSPMTTDAPACVETAVYQQGDTLILHLLNYASGQLRGSGMAGGTVLAERIPVHGINVWLEGPAPERIWQEDGKALPFALEQGGARFTVPVVDTHWIVLIKRGNGEDDHA